MSAISSSVRSVVDENADSEDQQRRIELGAVIRAWREKKGLARQADAVREGQALDPKLSTSYWSLCESGKIVIGEARLTTIAKVVGATPAQLRSLQYPAEHPEQDVDADLMQRLDWLLTEERRQTSAIESALRDQQALQSKIAETFAVIANPSTHRVSFSKGQSISSVNAVAAYAYKMLDRAANQPPPQSSNVIITSLGQDIFEASPDLANYWWHFLKEAQRRGWEVVHLIRIENTADLRETVVNHLLKSRVGPGRYMLTYVFSQDLQDRSKTDDVVIVPGQGAILIRSSEQRGSRPDQPVGAVFEAHTEEFGMLLTYYQHLQKAGNPIIDAHMFQGHDLKFSSAVRSLEENLSPRMLVMKGLSEAITPPEITERRLSRLLSIGAITQSVHQTINTDRKTKFHALREASKQFPCRDIVSKQAIEEFVEHGVYPRDDALCRYETNPAPEPERVAQLQSVLKLLTSSKYKYELALIDERDESQVGKGKPGEGIFDRFWLGKPGHGVVVEAWPSANESDELNIVINDSNVSNAFGMHFYTLWETLPSECTDQAQVISWLEHYLDRAQELERHAEQ